jgi:cytochrome c oxidase subunit II
MKRLLSRALFGAALGLALAACHPLGDGLRGQGSADMPMGSVAWGRHAFNSNGERLYFTATSERGTTIESVGGPAGSSWMMMHGQLACVSCHGVDGRGGRRGMAGMMGMEAKDIRWTTLSAEFNESQFAHLVREGREPNGNQLSSEMPRWRIGDDDLADLVSYLKTLH